MAETSVIREFLVALGYKHDETSLKKFEQGIAQATKTVFAFGAAVEATALTVAVGVSKFASNLEQLYFASQRTRASATALRAFGRAAQDFGSNAEEAQSAAESLAAFMRNSPAAGGFLASLGVHTTDAAGKARDTLDIMGDLGRFLASKPQYVANLYAPMFGIPDRLALAFRDPAFMANFAKISEELKKAGFQGAADRAHQFMMQLRRLGDQLTIFGTQIEDALQRKLKISIEGLTTWLQTNGPALADQVITVANKLLDAFNDLLHWTEAHWPQIARLIGEAFTVISKAIDLMRPAVVWVYDQFVKLDGATDGWSTKILALTAALKLLGAGGIISGLAGLTAGFVGLAGGMGAAVAAGVSLGYFFDKYFPNNPLKKAGESLSNMIYDHLHQKENAIHMLTNMGWTRAQAAGIVANFNAESALDPHAVGDNGHAYGLAQWHKDGQERFKQWAGIDIRDSTFQQQAEFFSQERHNPAESKAMAMIMAARNASQAAYNMSLYYERPAGGLSEAQRRGEAAATIYNGGDTTIHITAGSTREAADVFADRVARVNRASIREFAAGAR